MKAGIIAAGEGSRFVRAGQELPKPLIEVGGVSLLERTLRVLVQCGVTEVALIVNERIPQVVRFAEGLDLPVRLRSVVKTTESSMHSLYELSTLLGDDRFVLCTVDSVLLPEEGVGFIRRFAEQPEIALLLSYTEFIDDEKPLLISVDPGGRVLALGEEAAQAHAAGEPPRCTVGLYGLSPGVLPLLGDLVHKRVKKLRNYLGAVVNSGAAVHGYGLSKAIDVDRPEDLAVAEAFVRERGLLSRT